MLPRLPFVIAALILTAPAAAAPRPDALRLTVEAFQELEVDTGGVKEKQMVPIARAVPGTEVIYIITYENGGARPADNAVVTNPVPPELVYKPDSAFGSGARAEVSVDRGKRWGALEQLTVPDAGGKRRPARASDVTHVRWSLDFAVAPGAKGKVMYRATIK